MFHLSSCIFSVQDPEVFPFVLFIMPTRLYKRSAFPQVLSPLLTHVSGFDLTRIVLYTLVFEHCL